MNVICMGFPGSSCNVGDPGSVPGLGSSPGEGIGYPLQYSWAFLVAQMVKNLPAMSGDLGLIPGYPGAWQAAVPGFAKSQTRLSRAQYNMHIILTKVWEGR